MSKEKKKVLVGLSGGVDSSVTAALLVEQEYEVTGAYMKQWSDSQELSGVCSWKEDRRDALRVAAKLGIQLLTLDFEKEYKEWVMGYMFSEYEAGRTPNPDVMCNKFIKFGAWLEKAKELGFDYLATGHYATVARITDHVTFNKGASEDTCYVLRAAKDQNKDQTYFLHQIGQEQLAHAMFPLGQYTKDEVRELAQKFDLPTANRAESMGICFVGEVPMKQFLEQKISHKPGKIITTSGETIGEHDGLTFYTIGQRHGFQQKGGDKPLFVVEKRHESNELVVGYADDPLLFAEEMTVVQMHWVSGQVPALPLECEVRTRHRQQLQAVTIQSADADTLSVSFTEKQRALTPGQFAVFYKEGVCLGGGIIN